MERQKYLLTKDTVHAITDIALGSCAELPDKQMQVLIIIKYRQCMFIQ